MHYFPALILPHKMYVHNKHFVKCMQLTAPGVCSEKAHLEITFVNILYNYKHWTKPTSAAVLFLVDY